ncbi:hypothetical protein Tco_0718003 [Tanacetum coccineum]
MILGTYEMRNIWQWFGGAATNDGSRDAQDLILTMTKPLITAMAVGLSTINPIAAMAKVIGLAGKGENFGVFGIVSESR